MGRANGSRECAPDDKLRETHRFVLVGFACALPTLRICCIFSTTGKSAKTCPAPSQKIFRFCRRANQGHNLRHPVPPRGALAIVINVGQGAVDVTASGAWT